MQKLPKIMLVAVPLFVAGAALATIVGRAGESEEVFLTGMVEVEEVDVVPKIPGRIGELRVREGDMVAAGEVVATLTSRAVDAKAAQAEAAVAAAAAQLNKALRGARPEEIEAVRRQYRQARGQFELAETTYRRIQNVYDEGVVSTQERDQAHFKYEAARDEMEAARAQLELVRQGARPEDVDAAQAQLERSRAALDEARAYQEETKLTSPIRGEVVERIAAPGEVVAAGFPVVTLIDPSDAYLVLQVREDQLAGLGMGRKLQGTVPALGGGARPFEITYLAAMADFATWRATNERGDFDLKTFEVRLRPEEPLDGLRPGMTVRVLLHGVDQP